MNAQVECRDGSQSWISCGARGACAVVDEDWHHRVSWTRSTDAGPSSLSNQGLSHPLIWRCCTPRARSPGLPNSGGRQHHSHGEEGGVNVGSLAGLVMGYDDNLAAANAVSAARDRALCLVLGRGVFAFQALVCTTIVARVVAPCGLAAEVPAAPRRWTSCTACANCVCGGLCGPVGLGVLTPAPLVACTSWTDHCVFSKPWKFDYNQRGAHDTPPDG